MKPIIIKKYNVRDVFINDKILFNTNNHYIQEKIEQPKDYLEKQRLNVTSNWIDKFHQSYHKIVLDKQDLDWMRQSQRIGYFTRKFSHLFDDELEETCQKYRHLVPPGNWFIRTDTVSLKYGMYGCGPYNSIEEIIKSMVSTIEGHSCFRDTDDTCPIYFMNWQNIEPDKEFRIFVYQNEITAISTQNIYSPNEWLTNLTEDQIKDVVKLITDYFEVNIKDKLRFIRNYTMDLAILDEGTPYFIEPNSFGKYYAAGSALYQWVNDHDKLHDSSSIEFRFTIVSPVL